MSVKMTLTVRKNVFFVFPIFAGTIFSKRVLGQGTRSEEHPRQYWLAHSVINLGSFLLFLKEKPTIQALMIQTARDRPFPEFPHHDSVHERSSQRLGPSLSPKTQRTMPTLCHQHHNDPATHRRDDGQQPCVCVAWFPRTVDGGESGGECAGRFVRGCTWLPDLCAGARGSKTKRLR